MERSDFVERVSRSDRVDEEESFSRSHVLLPHCSAKSGQASDDGTRIRIYKRGSFGNSRVLLLTCGI